MQCPKCKSKYLKATKLEQGLSAMGCVECGGASISLLYYRDWVERSEPVSEISPSTIEEDTQDTRNAMSCPKCSKIMTKYKISGDVDNRLDLCSSCDEVWLDAGEWELIKSLELSGNMPNVFTESWQWNLIKQDKDKALDKRLLRSIDEDELTEVKRVKDWLNKHPKRSEIWLYLQAK